jgi:transcriptional regulator of met regulon
MTDALSPQFKCVTAKTPAAQKAKAKYPPPYSIRFTAAEKAWLKKKAAPQAVSTYIRNILLADESAPRRGKRVTRIRDDEALARTLAALGRARLSNNLNEIAKAAKVGALPVTPELIQELTDTCNEIREMRKMLMKALGLKPENT